MFRLCKQFHFEAAHSLPHLGPTHKCARVHGHGYVVEVVIAAEELDGRGFAGVDYAELDLFEEYLLYRFDHRNLNDLAMFCNPGIFTTAENLAQHFFGWCKAKWPQTECVRVSETRNTWVEYRE